MATVTNEQRSEIFKAIRNLAIKKCGKTADVAAMLVNLKDELAHETESMFLAPIAKKYTNIVNNNCNEATENGRATWR